jgi:predicted nucleic acid-binding protein
MSSKQFAGSWKMAETSLLSVTWVAEALHRRGVQRMLRENRRRLSLVDCVSFEFMRERGLREALALDSDFVEAGFRVLPSGVDRA